MDSRHQKRQDDDQTHSGSDSPVYEDSGVYQQQSEEIKSHRHHGNQSYEGHRQQGSPYHYSHQQPGNYSDYRHQQPGNSSAYGHQQQGTPSDNSYQQHETSPSHYHSSHYSSGNRGHYSTGAGTNPPQPLHSNNRGYPPPMYNSERQDNQASNGYNSRTPQPDNHYSQTNGIHNDQKIQNDGQVHYASNGKPLVIETESEYQDRREKHFARHYKNWSLCNTIFCFMVTGIAAMVLSKQVRVANYFGEYRKARRLSKITLALNIISIIAGILTISLAMAYGLPYLRRIRILQYYNRRLG